MHSIYTTTYDGAITLQEEEIESGQFMEEHELVAIMEKERFCPEALEIWKRMKQEECVEEIVDVIDEKDKVIDKRDMSYVRKNRLLHRGVAILLKDSKGNIFVHKRTATKKLYPSHYDVFVGGGVKSGETYEQAAIRETQEEVGIPIPKIKFLFKHRFSGEANCMFSVFSCIYDGELMLQKEEIESGKFVTKDALEMMMRNEKFCPDTLEIWKRMKDEKSLDLR